MSFSSFSKDYGERAFTSVENQFIAKYLPEADGDAVRAYLYGLYLCHCGKDFDAENAAKLLKIPYDRFAEIFSFWEECGLVQVLSKSPLLIEYLPVNASVGKPKPLRPEKYAQFNQDLFRLLQKANKDLSPYDHRKLLEFLEETPMEHQAFLLIVEYCIRKDGPKLSANHILNKAKQLAKAMKFTLEQVEADLADFHTREKELAHIFSLLGVYRKPQDADYEYLEKWLAEGMEIGAVCACASSNGTGSLKALDARVSELAEKKIFTESDAKAYLAEQEELASIVFKVAKKLGLKTPNPRPYIEEYAVKWLERGYDEESLTLLASLGLRLSYGFAELDDMIDGLYAAGVVDHESVREYCAARDGQLRLLGRIQGLCGVVKKSQATLDMIETWRNWSFSDEMILEAAKRSEIASAPLPYMNKLLSEWKRLGVSAVSEIPEKPSAPIPAKQNPFKSEAAIAADERTDRERFYAERKRLAMRNVERARAIAEKDADYKEAESVLRKGQLELAKAELYSPETLPSIEAKLAAAKERRAAALARLNLSDKDFVPEYFCKKCSDTGYKPDGYPCDCYKK